MKLFKFTFLALAASVYAASYAADYYWNGGTSGWATKASWSTTQGTNTPLTGALPGENDTIHLFYTLNKVGDVSTYTGLGTGGTAGNVSIGSGTYNYDKFIYDTVVAPGGTYVLDETDPENPSKTYNGGLAWQLYSANTTINLNLIKVANDIPSDNGNTLLFRKTDTGTKFDINVKKIEAYGGNIYLGNSSGSSGKGQHLTSVTTGEDTVASRASVTIDIKGTETSSSTFRVVSNSYTHYGKVEIENGSFYFAKGAGTYVPQASLEMNEDITLRSKGSLDFGASSSVLSATAISLGRVIVADNAKNAALNIYSSALSTMDTLLLGNTAADTCFRIATSNLANALTIGEVKFNESNINTTLAFGSTTTNLKINKIALAGVDADLPVVRILNYDTASTAGVLTLGEVGLSGGASLFAGNWDYVSPTSLANKFNTVNLGKLTISGANTIFKSYAQTIVLDNVANISGGAVVAFGAWGRLNSGEGPDFQYRLGTFTANSNITASGANTELKMCTVYLNLAENKSITIKEGAKAELMVGDSNGGFNIDGAGASGTINVESGSTLIMRRSSGSPVYNVKNLNIVADDKTTTMRFGESSFRVGAVNIDDLVLSYVPPTEGATVGASRLEIYTLSDTATVTAKIKNLTVGEYASGEIIAPTNLEIESLTTESNSRLTLNASIATVTGSVTNLSRYLTLGNTKFTVDGNFINNTNYMDGTTQLSFNISRTSASTFTVGGEFRNDGRVNLGYSSGTTPWEYSFGGITSTSTADTAKRIYVTYTGCGSKISLTGSGTYVYNNRIHDFGEDGVFDETYTGKISIYKTGSGKQYLAGTNYYRGDTVINAGELYLRADGMDIKDAAKRRGVADIYLNGGKFGAVGAVTASDLKTNRIGKVMADNFYFNNTGVLVFDLDLSSPNISDKFAIAGLFVKGEFSAEGKFMFEFICGGLLTQNSEYELIKFGDTDFTISDFDFIATDVNGNTVDLNGFFSFKDSSLYFTAIPEPSVYAAVFGVLALAFVLRRRRK